MRISSVKTYSLRVSTVRRLCVLRATVHHQINTGYHHCSKKHYETHHHGHRPTLRPVLIGRDVVSLRSSLLVSFSAVLVLLIDGQQVPPENLLVAGTDATLS